MNSPTLKLLILIGLVLLVACAPTSSPTPEPTAPPTSLPKPDTPEPTVPPTAPPKKELPKTNVTAVIGDDPLNTYKVDPSTFESLTFDVSELPVPPGSVEAHWYTSGGMYVVAYVGLDLTATGPLCPGNSIQTAQGFEDISNSPTEAGACEGFPNLITDPDFGPRICQGIVLYVTAIPSSKQGILWGTIEKLADGGSTVIGLTSQADTSPDIPEIDLDDFCQ